MVAELLPIFPLESVLVPGLPLPLHIFEPRYRQLVTDVCEPGGRRAFGVVALLRGREVGADTAHALDNLAGVGTVAEIIEIGRHPDGRAELLTVGSRRFRLIELDHDKPYLQAKIEFLEESDGHPDPELVRVAAQLCTKYVHLLAGVAQLDAPEDDPLAADPLRLSYQIAANLRLPNDERQRLLEAASAADRLVDGMRLLRRELTLLTQTRSIPIPPRAFQVDASSN
jgi:Lon protease-like protein